ncbi:triose-phosphate isomerase [Hymenobacter psoromatis]|nr:triose-phosphate isomerase [Hymenobacter psoromatis]
MRKKMIAGNWKMNKTLPEATALLTAIAKGLPADAAPGVTVVVCPPALYLVPALPLLQAGSAVLLGAQNCAQQAAGAYTGEISAAMLHSVGVRYVVLGHSERRHYFGETNALVAEKVSIALANKLLPICCCGESAALRAHGDYLGFVITQLSESLFHLSAAAFGKVVVAYEPLWAIGSGAPATAAQAQEMHAALRQHIAQHYGGAVAAATLILYGGSVTPSDADPFLHAPDIDGALVGGASLHANEFIALVQAAQRTVAAPVAS